MTTENDERPRYEGPRDSRTNEVLPPPGYERDSGRPAAEFDSEAFLEEGGYRFEKSVRKAAK
jgi:hypothetical protein